MVHHVYREKKGCLVRFSLLPSGAIKKAQVLGGKLRFMAFEWTHLASPKTVYERIVESMEVKMKLGKSRNEMKSEVVDRYGVWGETGWMNRNDPAIALEKSFGVPEMKSDNLHEWTIRRGDYLYSLKAVIKEGRFEFFHGDGLQRHERALENTVSWVGEQLEDIQEREDGQKHDYEVFLKVMHSKLPDHEAEFRDYRNWIETAEELIEAMGEDKGLLTLFLSVHRGVWADFGLLDRLPVEEKIVWYETVTAKTWAKDLAGKPFLETKDYGEVKELCDLIEGLMEVDPDTADLFLKKLKDSKKISADFMRLALLESWDAKQHTTEVVKSLIGLSEKVDQEKVRALFWHLYRREFQDRDLILEDTQRVVKELKNLKPKLDEEYRKWTDAIILQLASEE